MKNQKSPVSTICGILLAGAMVVSQLLSKGATNYWVIALAAIVAILGAIIRDEQFLGKSKFTSYIGYAQLVLVSFQEAIADGDLDWMNLVLSILGALALRGAADDYKNKG